MTLKAKMILTRKDICVLLFFSFFNAAFGLDKTCWKYKLFYNVQSSAKHATAACARKNTDGLAVFRDRYDIIQFTSLIWGSGYDRNLTAIIGLKLGPNNTYNWEDGTVLVANEKDRFPWKKGFIPSPKAPCVALNYEIVTKSFTMIGITCDEKKDHDLHKKMGILCRKSATRCPARPIVAKVVRKKRPKSNRDSTKRILSEKGKKENSLRYIIAGGVVSGAVVMTVVIFGAYIFQNRNRAKNDRWKVDEFEKSPEIVRREYLRYGSLNKLKSNFYNDVPSFSGANA